MNIIRSLSFGVTVFCCAIIVGSCKNPAHSKGNAATVAAEATLDEEGIRTLLLDARKRLKSIGTMTTSETKTIDGRSRAHLNPEAASSIAALRTIFSSLFTKEATDSIIRDFGIVEDQGKVWVVPAGVEDILDYNEAEITIEQSDSAVITATLEIPLGDSGQTEQQDLRLIRSEGRWRIANDPFSLGN